MTRTVLSILEEIKENSSTNKKVEIIKENEFETTFKRVVDYTLNPKYIFNIKKIPKYINGEIKLSLDEALDIIYKAFVVDLLRGNKAIELLKNTLEALHIDDAKVLERVIKKDLKCGANISLVNRVWEGLIYEIPVMLCQPFSQKLMDKITFPAFGQIKMDGMRFMAVVSKDGLFGTASCKIYSRNGNELDIGPIATSFAMFITKDHPTGVFDGELLVRDVNGNYLPRKEGNGILLKMQEGTATKEELNSVIAVVWDYITLEEFNSRKGIIPYSERLDRVRYFYDSIVPLGNISIIDTFEIKSQEDADFLFRQALVNKYEGIVVKTKDGLWKDGRANYQLKMKDFKSVELKVVDFQYSEDTKYAGGLGALVCEDFSGTVRVSVGSGFTDKERFTITPEYILDKIIEVKYSEIITSKKDKKKSLFLNSFMGIRHDKTIADSLE